MGFEAERIRRVHCPQCNERVDVSRVKPLSTIQCPACAAPVPAPVRIGTLLVTHRLGKGSGSRVYAAHDRVLGRRVALKVMRDPSQLTPARQDGVEEARALMNLRHPHVVEVYALNTWQGQPCIIMELLPGGSLREMIHREGHLPERRALTIATEAACALKATHEHGLLHLDVKPGNIMFDADGVTKLLDFGLGVIEPDERENETLGSPFYVSPELVLRRRPDFRSDIYSLGTTLFYALCGRPPFRGRTLRQTLRLRLRQQPPSVQCHNPCLGERTERVVTRMLARDPHDRHSDYDALLDDLSAAAEAAPPPDVAADQPTELSGTGTWVF